MIMTTQRFPAAQTLAKLEANERVRVLDLLFEPSTQLHTLCLPLLQSTTFDSYPDLTAGVGIELTALAESASQSDKTWLDDILGSHPRLGAKKVESVQSQAEQRQLQGSEAETAQLQALNDEYEAKYPGLRYVVFVNGRSRPVIMEDMRRRIDQGTLDGERKAAIKAMCEIAVDRASKLAS